MKKHQAEYHFIFSLLIFSCTITVVEVVALVVLVFVLVEVVAFVEVEMIVLVSCEVLVGVGEY